MAECTPHGLIQRALLDLAHGIECCSSPMTLHGAHAILTMIGEMAQRRCDAINAQSSVKGYRADIEGQTMTLP